MSDERATPSSPHLIQVEGLRGDSLRKRAREQLRAEGEALLLAEKLARQSRRHARQQRRADQLAETALMVRHGNWQESEQAGLFLAQDENGSWLAPTLRERTWFVRFNPLKPLHLVAWIATARTGKVVTVERP